MSYPRTTSDPALEAYAGMAQYYDRFTAGYVYDSWLARIEARALGLGMRGRRALDIACGTGKSFAPLLARGYTVTACDLSPEMIDQARLKFDDHVEDLFVADMRELPPLGTFDLVTCIDDAVNYLLDDEDLVAAFRAVAGVLAPNGIYVFDVNSLRTYRTDFAETMFREDAGGVFCWHGEGSATAAPGDVTSARIEAFLEEDDCWHRVSIRHVQRHHPPAAIRDALTAAGLECAAVAGQRPGCHLEDEVDEADHIKVVYFARLPGVREGGDPPMRVISG